MKIKKRCGGGGEFVLHEQYTGFHRFVIEEKIVSRNDIIDLDP